MSELNGLAKHILELEARCWFDLSPDDLAAIQRLYSLPNGAVPSSLSTETRARVAEIARSSRFYEPTRVRIETPLDDRVRVAEQEAEAAEQVRIEANETWRSAARELESEASRRFHKAAGNPQRMARVQAWLDERLAEIAGLEEEWRAADGGALRARARRNALLAAASRWRQNEDVRVRYEGETLTLQEFEKRRKHE